MNNPCTDTLSLFKDFSVAVFGSSCVGKATAENLIRNHIGSVYLICNEKDSSVFYCDHASTKELTVNDTDHIIHICPVPFSLEVFSYINLHCFDYIVDAMENIEENYFCIRKQALIKSLLSAAWIPPGELTRLLLRQYLFLTAIVTWRSRLKIYPVKHFLVSLLSTQQKSLQPRHLCLCSTARIASVHQLQLCPAHIDGSPLPAMPMLLLWPV